MGQNTDTGKVVVAPIAGTQRVRRVRSVETVEPLDYENQFYPGQEIKWPEFRDVLKRDLAPSERTAGLHFSALAPTRGGKTTLITKGILPIYEEVDVPVLIVDSTSDPKLKKVGGRMPRLGKMTGTHRVSVDSLSRESALTIVKAINRAYSQGDIVIYFDEVRHVADKSFLGLGKALENMYLFGGKRGVTVGGATQAPRWVPGSFYDQAKAHFLFRIRDDRSRKRVEEISGDTATLRPILPDLPKYHFAYVSPEGDVLRSKFALPRNSA